MTPSGTERTNFPQADDPVRSESSLGHRRGGSESSSMMDRGRPRKRLQQNASMSDLKAAATRTTDRKAFEELPKGWTPSVAINHLNATETDLLRKQAVGQAERFEVLSPEDVDNLSKVRYIIMLSAMFVLILLLRNSDALMKEQSISAARIIHYDLVDAIFTAAFANTCDHLEWLSSAMTPCSSKKRHWLSWMHPSTTGYTNSKRQRTVALVCDRSCLSMLLLRRCWPPPPMRLELVVLCKR